jgi:hypothetical protein
MPWRNLGLSDAGKGEAVLNRALQEAALGGIIASLPSPTMLRSTASADIRMLGVKRTGVTLDNGRFIGHW